MRRVGGRGPQVRDDRGNGSRPVATYTPAICSSDEWANS